MIFDYVTCIITIHDVFIVFLLLSDSTTNLKSLPRPPYTTSAEVIRIPCATDYESSASEAEEEEEATQRINTDTTTTEHTGRITMRNPSEKTTITNFQPEDDDWPQEGVDRRISLIQQSFAKATDHFLQITVPKQLQMRQSEATKKSAGSKAPDKNVPSEDTTNTQTDNNVVYKFRYSNASEGSIYSHRFDGREFRATK